MASVRIPLGSRKYPGHVALIDEEDAERVLQHHWLVDRAYNTWYARAVIEGALVSLHRLIMQPDADMVIDHINGNGLDCRRQNMRACTSVQNAANQRKHITNKSGYKGVSFRKARGTWKALIYAQNRQIYLGSFTDKESAARAYDAAAREHFGEFARLNFP